MKTWFEFPESTKFARTGRADVLYTPIYFANDGISAKFCFDNEWAQSYEDLSQLEARAQLIGKASLGFLSFGGRPASALDTRYALPSVGFRPIYSLTILEMSRRIRLEEAVDNRIPFEFRLPTSTLNDIQQIASSLKVVTADTISTVELFREVSPALIVSVQYVLVGSVHHNSEKKFEHDSEIRVFASLDQGQVPMTSPSIMGHNSLAELLQTSIIPLGKPKSAAKTGRRRDSVPILRRISRSSSNAWSTSSSSIIQDEGYLIIEVKNLEPFVFRTRDEASAAKFSIIITYHDTNKSTEDGIINNDDDQEAPPLLSANVAAMMNSHTSLTLEPLRPEDRPPEESPGDEYFHLRSKILPGKKLKLSFAKWERTSLPTTTASALHHHNDLQAPLPTPSESNPPRASTFPVPAEGNSDNGDHIAGHDHLLQAQVGQTEQNQTDYTRLTRAYTLPTTTTAPPVPPPDLPPPPSMSIPAPPQCWTTEAELWLTHPITSPLTPSFTTPYINHMYTLSLSLALVPDSSSSSSKMRAFKSLKTSFVGAKPTVELTVPVQVRYDLGLVPSYEVDSSLPEYDFSLPAYDDAVGYNPGALESLSAPTHGDARDGSSGGPRVEDDITYEARISSHHNTEATSPIRRITDNHVRSLAERHRWQHTNINAAVTGDGEDDDVLQMLMRDAEIQEGGAAARRVYGDDINNTTAVSTSIGDESRDAT